MEKMECNRDIDVSFVVIARNEEKNIGSCIKSVLDAAKDIDSEVIVVDSASTDRTREIVGGYPAKIVGLSGSNRLTASAGRYVGSLYAKGKYIFFVDGDMILDPGFLPHAIEYLSKNSNVAVSGWITQGDTLDPYLKTIGDSLRETRVDEVREVKTLYGTFVLRKSFILEENFDPFLFAGEEGELCDRAIRNGYKLKLLPHRLAHHVVDRQFGVMDVIRKKPRFSFGEGQVLRRSFRNKSIFLRLYVSRFNFLYAIFALSGIVGAMLAIYHGLYHLIYLWIICFIFMILAMFRKYADAKAVVSMMLAYSIAWIFFIIGFIAPVKNRSDYKIAIKNERCIQNFVAEPA